MTVSEGRFPHSPHDTPTVEICDSAQTRCFRFMVNPTSSSRTLQPSFRGDLSPSLTADTPWHFHLSPNHANHWGQCIPPAIFPFSRAFADARRLTLAQTTCYPIARQRGRRERNTGWLMESEQQGRTQGFREEGCTTQADWRRNQLPAFWLAGVEVLISYDTNWSLNNESVFEFIRNDVESKEGKVGLWRPESVGGPKGMVYGVPT